MSKLIQDYKCESIGCPLYSEKYINKCKMYIGIDETGQFDSRSSVGGNNPPVCAF